MSSAAAAWREEKDAGEVKTRKQQREIEKLERGLEEERLKREEAERGGGGGGGEGRKEGRNEEMEGRLKLVREREGGQGRKGQTDGRTDGGGRRGGSCMHAGIQKTVTQRSSFLSPSLPHFFLPSFPSSLPPSLPR